MNLGGLASGALTLQHAKRNVLRAFCLLPSLICCPAQFAVGVAGRKSHQLPVWLQQLAPADAQIVAAECIRHCYVAQSSHEAR